jgi:pyruvate kinase
MPLPQNKTKIVCTVGPATATQPIMEAMIRAGMNVARLNFAHGDLDSHKQMITNLRQAAQAVGQQVAILGDLPGPKIRLGELLKEPVALEVGAPITLSTQEFVGNERRISISFVELPQAVRPGDLIFVNDGYIQLEVQQVEGQEVHCRVSVGGELRSRQGVNLPGIDLGVSIFTDEDRAFLAFAVENGVDAVSQSFVEKAADLHAVRQFAADMGHHPFIVAKIERLGALRHTNEILEAADGIMIARGDLGVEVPIEELPAIQKRLMRDANVAGKPVITATQMLESMTSNPRPTRAEATDVANAVLDGTDCVMLSGESAIGKYPVQAVTMLSRIAAHIEPLRPAQAARQEIRTVSTGDRSRLRDLIALGVETTSWHASPAVVIVPTLSGATARRIARFRLPMWLVAVSSQASTCQELQFSYGVHAEHVDALPTNWKDYARSWLEEHGIEGDLVILTEGPSARHPEANDRIEIIDLRPEAAT